jgi:hypothetical protein
MTPEQLSKAIGIKVVIVPDYTVVQMVMNRYPKKRASKRWMKKYRKRYGMHEEVKDMGTIPDGQMIQSTGLNWGTVEYGIGRQRLHDYSFSEPAYYMNKRTFQAIVNHPEMVKYTHRRKL